MATRAWAAAQGARTLADAHMALVALRPGVRATRSEWVSYYLRSAEVYRQVADVDQDHHGHAMYWAEREKAKADLLNAKPDTSTSREPTSRRRKASDSATGGVAVMPSTLEDAHEALSKLCPSVDAGPAAWLVYHQRAGAIYTEVAEVDRAHHHEALFYAGVERRTATALSAGIGAGVDTESSMDSACP